MLQFDTTIKLNKLLFCVVVAGVCFFICVFHFLLFSFSIVRFVASFVRDVCVCVCVFCYCKFILWNVYR